MKGGPYIIEREFFRELREENGYYVDKTFFIEQFLLDPAHPQRSREQGTTTVFLRPRRFGKTMFLTMLDSFFNIRKDNRKLFEGLAVSANRELCEKWMNRYPVIYLNLQNAQGDDFADALTSLGFAITDVLREPKKLSGTSAEYKEAFRKIAYRKADRDLLQKSLRLLTAALAEHYQKPVILLIDEADVPVAKGAEFGYYEEMDEFMRGFYRETLVDNPALQFAFLLGRMRMTGEEVLCSGAAKAETYGLEDRKYSDLFGFTEEELDRLLQETGYVDAKEDIREWYGGYHLGGRKIFSPWSLMRYLGDLQFERLHDKKASARPKSNWDDTSDAARYLRFLILNGTWFGDDIVTLLAGVPPVHDWDTSPFCAALVADQENIWSWVHVTGFLTAAGQTSSGFSMAIPNREIYELLFDGYGYWFRNYVHWEARDALKDAIWKGNGELLVQMLEEIPRKHLVPPMYVGGEKAVCPGRSKEETGYLGLLAGFLMDTCSTDLSLLDKGTICIRSIDRLTQWNYKYKQALVMEIRQSQNEEDDLAALAEERLAHASESVQAKSLEEEPFDLVLYWGVAFCRTRDKSSCVARARVAKNPSSR